MIERPDIADTDLARWVGLAWALDVSEISFMPVGLDGWAFELNTTNGRFFLKVKREFPGCSSVLVPHFLRDQGITQVVAPIETVDSPGAYPAAGYWLLLYPYVGGGNLWNSGLSDEQWIEYGRLLAAVHTVALPTTMHLTRETFTTTAPDRIRAMAGGAARSKHLADFWTTHGERIEQLAEQTQRLAVQAATVAAVPVLCHADIHPGNLLADSTGKLHVVDWDAPIAAPRERDLMFVFSGDFGEHPINAHREALFRRGYGPVDLDPTLMDYYVSERRLDDIALFVKNILDEDVSQATRENELFWLRRCVAP